MRHEAETQHTGGRSLLVGVVGGALLATGWLLLHAAGVAADPPTFPDLPSDLLTEDREPLAADEQALTRSYQSWRGRVQQHNAAGCGQVEAGSAQATVCAERKTRLLQEHDALHAALKALQARVKDAQVRAALARCRETVPALTAQAHELETKVAALTQQLQRAEQAYARAQGEEQAARAVEVARMRDQVGRLKEQLDFLLVQVRTLATTPSQAASVCAGARPVSPARPEPPVP